MGRRERIALIEQIERERGSRLICYVTSDRQNADAGVAKDAMPYFYEHLRTFGGAQKIDILLFTNGGDTLAGFGLSRLVREFCSQVGVLVPLRCHSAGTLIALGANEIVMTKGATLSPIDPTVVAPLNPAIEMAPGQRQIIGLSVESVAGFQDLVTQNWGLKGEEALSAALRALTDKVHPIALGDVYRARQQIELLAKKLLGAHRSDEEQIRQIVKTLTRGLGSHDYMVSRSEARELLGAQVAGDSATVEDLIWDAYRDYATEMTLGVPFDPGLEIQAARAGGQAAAPTSVTQRLAAIETTGWANIAERQMVLADVTGRLPPGMVPGRAIQQEIVRSGWVRYS